MRLSTKATYGMRALLDLARHSGEGPVLLKDIAKRQGITLNYLEQIFIRLNAAGLIRSIRGSRGGFILSRSPSEIRLDEVIQALEGRIVLVECVDNPKVCPRVDFCVTRDLWGEMGKRMSQVLQSTTLQHLVERQSEKEQLNPRMYYI